METNTIILLAIAAVVLLAVIVLVARRKPAARVEEEGHGVSDELAAAVEDIVGPLLGIDAHRDKAAEGTTVPPSTAAHPTTIASEPEEPALPEASALPADDLTRLKGLGPKAAATLNELGIHRYAQLATLDGPGVARVDAAMGTFKGRILRDRWVEQARYLAEGDIPGFEARFGKLG